MIHPGRIQVLNADSPTNGTYVLYWMQASQREEYNHALEYALEQANEHRKPLVVYFGLTDSFPEANLRHYRFMLEGLFAVREAFENRGIKMIIQLCSPEEGALAWSRDAVLAVVDRGYLKVQKQWRARLAQQIGCPLHQVESDVVVPVETASLKEEYSAGTFRPRIKRHIHEYCTGLRRRPVKRDSLGLRVSGDETAGMENLLQKLSVDRSVSEVSAFNGGTGPAKKILSRFINERCDYYEQKGSDPAADMVSDLSPYMHFGQISPVYIVREISRCNAAGKDAFLEELIVRRELSINYIHYNDSYDSYKSLPAWARETLNDHQRDRRPYEYDLNALERGDTHDRYWNAAQSEMVHRGKMHGYMRMYWGKKIIEWSPTPREAFSHALYLNNKYEIDGRDPNGFTGVAWCFGKHDRAWPERPVFGKVRYMNAAGLERKFDMAAYIKRIEQSS